MKISAIKAILTKAKQAFIYEDQDGGQWIGTEAAAYPLESIQLNEQRLIAMFDLTPKQEGELTMGRRDWAKSGLKPQTVALGTETEMPSGLPFMFRGELLIPLAWKGRMYLLRHKLAKAADGNGDEYRRFYIGLNADCEPLILITNGMILGGVARPEPVGDARMIGDMYRSIGELTPDGTGNSEEASA